MTTLLDLDELGLIPGPYETEEEFKKRADYCMKQEMELPFPKNSSLVDPILQKGTSLAKQLFGISPKWLPVVFSNEKLSLWHAGCAWIFQWKEETPLSALLQLTNNTLTTHSLSSTP